MMAVLSIAAGGALGAVARHFVNVGAVAVFGLSFPWGTLIVNIAGSFLMGVLIGLLNHTGYVPQAWRAFLAVGFLGAFTTFSAFSLDTVTLYERGDLIMAVSYIGASVVLSIAGLFAGLFLIRTIFA